MEWIALLLAALIGTGLICWWISHIVDGIVEGRMEELRQEAYARYRIPAKRLSSNAQLPRYMTAGAAAADLMAIDEIRIYPGVRTLVKTGISGAIPEGCVGLVCSRSGLALKHGVIVANAPGVIDSDYRGEWGVILINLSRESFVVERGMRVAQLLVLPVEQYDFEEADELELDDTARGSGGFGHTGD